MKLFKSIFLLCAISLLFDGCVQDFRWSPDNGSVAENHTFITVYFNLPYSGTTKSTAGTGVYGEQTGEEGENIISTLNLILVEAQAGGSDYTFGNVAAVVKGIVPTKITDTRYSFTTSVDVEDGDYRIFLIANPDNSAAEMTNVSTGMSYATFVALQHTCTSYVLLGTILYSSNRFLMTNVYDSERNDVITITSGGVSSTTIDMERTAARIDYLCKNADNIYTSEITGVPVSGSGSTPTVTFQLTKAALANVSKGFWYFKHLSADEDAGNATIEASESETNYVIDTDWATKQSASTSQVANFFYPAGSLSGDMADGPEWKNLSGDYATPVSGSTGRQLFYTSENTVPAAKQIQDRCTALLLQCEVTSDFFNGYDTVMIHNNIIYTPDADGAYPQLDDLINTEYSTTVAITNSTAATTLESYKIMRLARASAADPFITYYVTWIRHRNNNDATVGGPMEFSIVRNTIYRLRVASIKGFGTELVPDNPVEETSSLSLQVEVLDWNTREIEFPI